MSGALSRPLDEFATPRRWTWRTLGLVSAFYLVCLLAFVHKPGWDLRNELPGSLEDPLQHIWVMRWMQGCLTEGRSPVICREIEYPVGSPLGNFSPLQFQSMLFAAIWPFTGNDILTYNLIWFCGFLLAGVGTFVLAWQVTESRGCATFAGLTVMLSRAMMGRAYGHLELMFVGSFPLFLVGWIQFIDLPNRRRLLPAASLYVFVAICAAYYMVLATLPAALYVVWIAFREGRTWIRRRVRWLAAFAGVVTPVLALLFISQIWAAVNGHELVRSRQEYDASAAPLKGYVFPLTSYTVNALLPWNPYRSDPELALRPDQRNVYLGVLVLGLSVYAAFRLVRFPRAGYFWATLALLVTMGLGSYAEIGGRRIPLPAAWAWTLIPPFRLIRDPARFSMFATVIAAVIAAAGLKQIIGRSRRTITRNALVGLALMVTLLDLAQGFSGQAVPPMPSCYARLRQIDPEAAIVDVCPPSMNALCGYWQSLHGGRSTVSFSGLVNLPYLSRITLGSPFHAGRLENPNYLGGSTVGSFDLLTHADLNEYAWLFLTANDLRFVVIHKNGLDGPWEPPSLDRLDAALAEARLFEDEATVVYDRERLSPPRRPTLVATDGWRTANREGAIFRVATETARLIAYNPDPARPLRLEVVAQASGRDRLVRVLCDGEPRARWNVGSREPGRYEAILDLPPGLVEIVLNTDGQRAFPEPVQPLDPGKFSLRVQQLTVTTEPRTRQVALNSPPD